MRLISIHTENFKKLGTFNCEFTDGLNVIAGENAAGKSTLLQAIQCAFYGPSVVPGKTEQIPTWGSKNFKVTLVFSWEGARYELVRSKSTATLKKASDGESANLVASGSTPVTGYIESLFGLDAKDYDLFMQSKQGSSTGMLMYGATALNRKVEEFAGVDIIDQVQDRANKKAAAARAVEDASLVTAEQMGDAEQAVTLARKEVDDAGARVSAFNTAVQNMPAKPAPLEGETVSQMHARAKHAASLLNQLEAAERELETAKGVLEGYKADLASRAKVDVTELEGKLSAALELGNSLKQHVADDTAATAAYSRQQTRVAQCEDTVAQAKVSLSKLSVVSDEALQNMIEGEEGTKEALAETQEALTKAMLLRDQQKALADGATCPTCGQDRTEHDPAKLQAELVAAVAAVSQLAEDKVGKQDAHTQAAKQLEQARRDRRALEQAEKDLATAEGVLAGYKKELETLQAPPSESERQLLENSLEDARANYASIKAKLDAATKDNAVYQSACDLVAAWDRKVASLADSVATLDEAYGKLEEPPTDDEINARSDAEDQRRLEISDWIANMAKIDVELSLAKQAGVSAQRNLDLHQKELDRLFDLGQKALGAADKATKYERLAKFLRERRQAYLQSVWTTVGALSSALVNEASAGLITGVDNREGEFWFREDGVWAPVTAASGAQRSFIGVNLKVGLTRALYGANTPMLFDEPTESCSERNASGMASVIATSARQVLLITHRERDQVLAQNIINVGA